MLGDLVVGLDGGEHADVLPEYFSQLADLVVNARTSGLVSGGSWRAIKNKIIYNDHAKNFLLPKVERDAGINYKDVWRLLLNPVLTADAKDVIFLLIHNKLPVKERLFRIGLLNDPYCQFCPGGVVEDLEVFFCACDRVSQVWSWVTSF